MVTSGGSNYDTLVAEGVIYGELPEAHRAVVDDLGENEVQTLVKVYKQLSKADAEIGRSSDVGERPDFTEIVL